MNLLKHEEYKNLKMKDYVYNVLKKNIIYLKLKPGKRLIKKEIKKEFNVSRTPIREAFIKLQEEALIDVYPQRATYVSYIDLKNVEEAKFMRNTLEKEIVKLAAQKRTEEIIFELETNLKLQEISFESKDHLKLFEYDSEFHKILFACADKIKTWAAIDQISTDLKRMRILALSTGLSRKKIIEDHQKVIEALKKADADYAEEMMQSHLARIKIDQEKLINKYPDYFN
ncbi:GntR family transcriptional regulator [Halanaerobium hydrogeniformans]|uniref:Transcriptional regulator, GntR family n=1 Tax=Halanaerobium hydrogeniformans TaxID=656519 RepID=E4RPX9_HALHG|nr:GntR family transcriptional regulator [Halanaerobium hydrogeniformans]ADQ14346.1 transcriptional regulator, GntR family [Halanaerobium hydrogeniformans]